MAKRRYGKKAQQQELTIMLAAIALIGLAAGIGSLSPSVLVPMIIFLICVAVLGAAGYYVVVYRRMRIRQAGLRQLQIDDVDQMSGVEFERYMADLFRRQGYHFETTAASGDLGVDLIIIKNSVRTAVQIKRYSKPVNQAAIREAVAGMKQYRCARSMVVTNSYFTKLAIQLARTNDCVLIDREALIEMIAREP